MKTNRRDFIGKEFISELHVNVLMSLRTTDKFYCIIQKNPVGEKHNLLWESTALKIYGFWTTNYIKKNLVSWWDMCSHNSILDIRFQKKLLAQKQTSDCLVFLRVILTMDMYPRAKILSILFPPQEISFSISAINVEQTM